MKYLPMMRSHCSGCSRLLQKGIYAVRNGSNTVIPNEVGGVKDLSLHLEDVAFASNELIQDRANDATEEETRDQAGDDHGCERLPLGI
jgi:hypothetical protein